MKVFGCATVRSFFLKNMFLIVLILQSLFGAQDLMSKRKRVQCGSSDPARATCEAVAGAFALQRLL